MGEETMGPMMVLLGDLGDARLYGIGIGRKECGNKLITMDDDYFQPWLPVADVLVNTCVSWRDDERVCEGALNG